ncbi:hypothetical protein EDB86DRAFT_2831945 [Lactarius hatsudake]|nr:hypothetical protein EDB86DRAFT_2831945 [Lactarius hatsudake]
MFMEWESRLCAGDVPYARGHFLLESGPCLFASLSHEWGYLVRAWNAATYPEIQTDVRTTHSSGQQVWYDVCEVKDRKSVACIPTYCTFLHPGEGLRRSGDYSMSNLAFGTDYFDSQRWIQEHVVRSQAIAVGTVQRDSMSGVEFEPAEVIQTLQTPGPSKKWDWNSTGTWKILSANEPNTSARAGTHTRVATMEQARPEDAVALPHIDGGVQSFILCSFVLVTLVCGVFSAEHRLQLLRPMTLGCLVIDGDLRRVPKPKDTLLKLNA